MAQGSGNATERKAADRLLRLAKRGETDADFARRLELTPQLVSNYRNGRNGLSLIVLSRIASRLSGDELLYVVTGRKGRLGETAHLRAKADGYDRIIKAVRSIIKDVEGGDAPELDIGPPEN